MYLPTSPLDVKDVLLAQLCILVEDRQEGALERIRNRNLLQCHRDSITCPTHLKVPDELRLNITSDRLARIKVVLFGN